MTDFQRRVTVDTTIHDNGDIVTLAKHSDTTEFMTQWVIRTRDDQIRKALIDLGWTPPKGE